MGADAGALGRGGIPSIEGAVALYVYDMSGTSASSPELHAGAEVEVPVAAPDVQSIL
jgi:hypothetical protein